MKHFLFGKKVFWILGAVLVTACAVNNPDIQKRAESSRTLGEVYYSEGKYTAALKEFIKVEKLTPNDPVLHNDLGLVYLEKNHVDFAVEHFNKAILLDPEYLIAKNNLGTAYLRDKRWDEAIALYTEMIASRQFDLYDTPYLSYFNLALAYYNNGDLSAAIEYYELTLEIAPGYVDAIFWLGIAYRDAGKLEEAIKMFEKAATIAPKAADIQFRLGEVRFMAGYRDKALDAFLLVLELAPETVAARKARQEIEKIQSFK